MNYNAMTAKLAKEQAILEEIHTTLNPLIAGNRAFHVADTEKRISALRAAIQRADQEDFERCSAWAYRKDKAI